MRIEEIPFIKKSRENWVTNFNPSWYLIVMKQILLTLILLNCYPCAINAEYLRSDVVSPYMKNKIKNGETSLILFSFYIGLLGYSIQTFFNIIYFFELVYREFYEKP